MSKATKIAIKAYFLSFYFALAVLQETQWLLLPSFNASLYQMVFTSVLHCIVKLTYYTKGHNLKAQTHPINTPNYCKLCISWCFSRFEV